MGSSMKFFRALLVLSLAIISIPSFAAHHGESDSKKAVLVTGATSGLGLKMTQTLA